MRDIAFAYDKSAISELLPKVYLSKNTLSDFLARLASQRPGMLAFMRSYTNYQDDTIIFDGSSFLSGSKENPFVDKGYCPGKRNRTQIRLIYAFSQSKKMPVYFRVLPGNVTDMSSFETCIAEMSKTNCLAVLDKGFNSAANIKTMKQNDISFIMALRVDAAQAKDVLIEPGMIERGEVQFFQYHKRVIFYRSCPSTAKGCTVYAFYDNERHKEMVEGYFRSQGDSEGNLPEDLEVGLYEKTKHFGTSVLLTSTDLSAKEVYNVYKTRWDIEEMFDHHKNTLGFDMQGETRQHLMEGWAFIEFLSLLMFYSLNSLLSEKDLLKTYTVKTLLFRSSVVTQVRTNGKWAIYNMTKKMGDLYRELGVTVEPIA